MVSVFYSSYTAGVDRHGQELYMQVVINWIQLVEAGAGDFDVCSEIGCCRPGSLYPGHAAGGESI